MNNSSDERDNKNIEEIRIKKLKEEVKKYKKAFNILNEYFDSISWEEQEKVADRLAKLGL